MSEDCRIAMSIAVDSDTHRVQRLSDQTSPTNAQAAKERPMWKSLSMSAMEVIFVCETYLVIRARLARKAGRVGCFIFTSRACRAFLACLAVMRHSPWREPSPIYATLLLRDLE